MVLIRQKHFFAKRLAILHISYGRNQVAQILYRYISEHYPQMELVAVIDKYNSVTIGDCKSVSNHRAIPKELIMRSLIIVTAFAANKDAFEFAHIVRKESDVCFCNDE